MNINKKICALLALFILAASAYAPAQWRALDAGLEFAAFRSPQYEHDSAAINVLRISTKHHELTLRNASHPAQGELLTARQWAQKENLTAVINAAMYQTDYRTSVSLMHTSGHVNNSFISKDRTILVFEPLQKNIPAARIVDLDCDDFDKIRPQYGSAVQSIRMISCTGRNVWQQSEKQWSIAAIGIDKSGNLLFIQSTAPHTVHDFINILRGLPIAIDRAMYMEGGSPSQMYVNTPKDTMEFIGDFSGGGKSAGAAMLPNVVGVRKIK
jgi:uncharacterized protein YigE (DUF2233 family)